MVYEENPLSILALPPINNSSAADAIGLYNTTIAYPVAHMGYYVLPIEVIDEMLKAEGIDNPALLVDTNPSVFRDYFGVDAVLFTTIDKWNTAYYLIGGHVRVAANFRLVSCKTGEELWRYKGDITIDTSRYPDEFSEDPYIALIELVIGFFATAFATAEQDYVPIALKVNETALNTLPYGKYHGRFGTDQDTLLVNPKFIPKD